MNVKFTNTQKQTNRKKEEKKNEIQIQIRSFALLLGWKKKFFPKTRIR